MPRFFFHLEHHEALRDVVGMDLPDLAAAKCEAFEVIARKLCDRREGFWDADTFQVTATDLEGLTLFVLDMMVVMAPAVRSFEAPLLQP